MRSTDSSLLRFTPADRVTRKGMALGIRQQFGSNALNVARSVKDELKLLALNFPPGLHYEVALDTTTFIQAGAEEVVVSLVQSVVLVTIVLFLFLQNWRAALITAIVIPIAFIGTFIFVKLLGFSINTLTLFGLTLATGLVVDDAIVIVEDISRRIQDLGMRPREAAIASMNALFGVVLATSLVLMTVFVPIAFFPGTTGQLYKQFALTIAFSVGVSTFNAVTFTPMLSALLLRSGQMPNHRVFNPINRTIESIRDRYSRSIETVVRHQNLVLGLFAAALVATYGVYKLVPSAFIPEEDQGYFITVVKAPEGVSLNYTEKVLARVEAILKQRPEVQNIFAIGGFNFSGATPNNGLIFCNLKPWPERTRPEQSVAGLIDWFSPKFMGIKEATVSLFPPPAISGLGEVGGFEFHLQDRTGVGFIEMGKHLDRLMKRASTYPSSQSPSLTDLHPTFNANTPQITVEVDRVRASQLQVSVEDVFNTLQILLGSTYVNDFNQFQRAYRVYVQADRQFRSNPEDINRLYVRSQAGKMISLGNLVRITQTIAPSIISHYNLFRSVEINGAAAPGISSGQAIAAMETVAKETLPKGFSYEWSGLSLEEIQSGSSALFIFGLGIVFVFLTLAAQYENYIDPMIIMLTVPLAILGALVAVWVKGTAQDVYTQIGFVMLVGMASKNSILIVEFANHLYAEGASLTKAVVEAGRERLRPILMTAIATIVGAVPLLIATGPGSAARQSLGTAIVGGMCVATVLSLFIVPVLYVSIKSLAGKTLANRELPESRDPQLLEPNLQGTQAEKLRVDGYRHHLEQLLIEAISSNVPVETAIFAKLPQINALSQEYGIKHEERERLLGELFEPTKVLLLQSAALLERLHSLSLQHRSLELAAPLQPTIDRLLSGTIEDRQAEIVDRLLKTIERLDDPAAAQDIARTTRVLGRSVVEKVLNLAQSNLAPNIIELLLEDIAIAGIENDKKDSKLFESDSKFTVPKSLSSGSSDPTSDRAMSRIHELTVLYLDPKLMHRLATLGPSEVLIELIADLDPLVKAASLYALNKLDRTAARQQAQQIDGNRDPLFQEIIDRVLGQKEDLSLTVHWQVKTARPRRQYGTLDKLLRLHACYLFKDIPPHRLVELARCSELKLYRAGEIICAADTPADRLWLSISGSVQVGNQKVGRGRSIGEIAVLNNSNYSATAIATEPKNITLAIAAANLNELITKDPIVARSLLPLVR